MKLLGNFLGKMRRSRNKYGNVPVTVDGVRFDSKREYAIWKRLVKMEENGEISGLQRQVTFVLLPDIYEEYVIHLKTKDKVKTRVVQRAVTYTADFVYNKGDEVFVCDVKASKKSAALDKAYTLRKKMMRALLGIAIVEIYDETQAL
jgi:hypothetical protein